MSAQKQFEDIANQAYKYGFKTEIQTHVIPKGLDESVIRLISAQKKEPDFVLQFRLKAYRHWLTMTEPKWSHVSYLDIDFQDIHYYAAPKPKEKRASMDEVDPELRRTFEKLGIPLTEQKRLANVAVDAIFDSVSVATTYREKLLKHGVVFCPLSEAITLYPDLVEKYMGSVVPFTDNYYAALNSAVFTEGSFVYVPKDTVCPMELSTYFRINTEETGQFERTLIICEDNS